jgi:hypothetical protein
MPQEAKSRFEPQETKYQNEPVAMQREERNLVDAIHNLGREEIYHGEVEMERPQVARG